MLFPEDSNWGPDGCMWSYDPLSHTTARYSADRCLPLNAPQTVLAASVAVGVAIVRVSEKKY